MHKQAGLGGGFSSTVFPFFNVSTPVGSIGNSNNGPKPIDVYAFNELICILYHPLRRFEVSVIKQAFLEC